MTNWKEVGVELVRALEAETDEEEIAALCREVVEEICDEYDKPNSRKNPLTILRKAVSEKFPPTSKQSAKWQYFTNSGKGNQPRWEHLALKYLTLSEKDWDAFGGNDRAKWKASQQQIETTEVAPTTEITPTTKNLTLADMNIDQLELDPQSKETVEKAVAQSGMSLAQFVQKSLQVYAKIVVGRTRKQKEDLTTISTEKLLKDKEFSTHPGRASELTKRGIRAIMIYNDEVATSKDQKWCITQSAVNQLISARANSVQSAMEPFLPMIDDHNSKHELSAYNNRKGRDKDGNPREIYREIDLCKLVPDGLS
jgi:hypothetical protein